VLPYASSLIADPGASATAIRNICKVLNIKVSVDDLEKDAENIEAEIAQKLKRTQKSRQNMYV